MSLTLEMPQGKAPKSKSKLRLIIVLILIICLGGTFAWIYSGRIISPDAELTAGFVSVIAPMSSTLAEILVEPNARVQAGQLLAKLDGGDYLQQMAAAQALVQGALSTTESNAERVAAAQKAAEEMVERIALARHEENTRKILVEKRSIEHAQAQLNMRNVDTQGGTEAQKATARKAELTAQQNLQNAKAAFEHASTSRSAIETELHKIRNSQGHMSKQNAINAPLINPTLIHASTNGYLTNNIPLVGQIVTMNESVFQIIPEVGAKLNAVAKLPMEAKNIAPNTLCFIVPDHGWNIFAGKVSSINLDTSTADISLNLENINDANEYAVNNKAKAIFWAHPLAELAIAQPLFMVLSYLPL